MKLIDLLSVIEIGFEFTEQKDSVTGGYFEEGSVCCYVVTDIEKICVAEISETCIKFPLRNAAKYLNAKVENIYKNPESSTIAIDLECDVE